MKKIINPWSHREGYDCFGCCPDNPLGVRMTFMEDGEDVVSFWKPGEHYQGWINTLHGGIIATLIDETAGWVVFRKLQTSGMTIHLDVHYRKAVMTTDGQIEIRGRIAELKRNMVFIDVVVKNSSGEVCSEGRATYFCMKGDEARDMGFESCEVEE